VACGGHDNTIKLWPLPEASSTCKGMTDAHDVIPIPGVGTTTHIRCVAVGTLGRSPAGPPVLVGTADGTVWRVDPQGQVEVFAARATGDASAPQQLCLSADNALAFIGYSSGSGQLLPLVGERRSSSWSVYPAAPVFFAAFAGPSSHTRRHRLVTGNAVGRLDVWDVDVAFTSEEIAVSRDRAFQMRRPRERVSAVHWLEDGPLLLVGDVDGNVHVFGHCNSAAGETHDPVAALYILPGAHTGRPVRQWYGDGTSDRPLCSIGLDGAIRFYTVTPQSSRVPAVALASSDDGRAKDVGGLLAIFGSVGPGRPPRAILGMRADRLLLWDAAARALVRRFACGPKRELVACSFADMDGAALRYLVVWVHQFQLCVARSQEANTVPRPPEVTSLGMPFHGAEVHDVLWLPSTNGAADFLLTASEDTTLCLVHAPTARNSVSRSFVLRGGHTSGVRCVAFLPSTNPNEGLVFSAGGREELAVWNVKLESLSGVLLSSRCISPRNGARPPPIAGPEGVLGTQRSEEAEEVNNDESDDDEPVVPRQWEVRQAKERRRLHCRILSIGILEAVDGGCLVVLGCSDAAMRVFRFFADGAMILAGRSSPTEYGPLLSLAAHHVGGRALVWTGTTSARILCWDLTSFAADSGLPSSDTVDASNAVTLLNTALSFPAHQSGVNALAVQTLEDDCCLVVSGGDDQSLNAAVVRMTPDAFGVTSSARVVCASGAAIRAVRLDGGFVFVAAVDQRVSVYVWRRNTTDSTLQLEWLWSFVSHTPAVGCLAVQRLANRTWRLAVGGQGLETVTRAQETTWSPDATCDLH